MTSRIRLTFAAACLALGLMIGTAGAALAANPSGSGQPSIPGQTGALEIFTCLPLDTVPTNKRRATQRST